MENKYEIDTLTFFCNFYNSNDKFDTMLLQKYNRYYKCGSNAKLQRMYKSMKSKLLLLSNYLDTLCNSIENKLNINKKLEIQLKLDINNNLIIIFYDYNNIIYTEKIKDTIINNFNYCTSIYVTNILSEKCGYLYEQLINHKTIEPFESIKWSKIHVHDKICIQTNIKPSIYGTIINEIIDYIIDKSKISNKNDINNLLYQTKINNNINIYEYIPIIDFEKIIVDFLKRYNNIDYQIYCNNNKIYGVIDFIFDDMLIDLKVYSKYHFSYREYLQLILYHCLYNKTMINKIGIYDFYNGEINFFDISNINKTNILNIVYDTFNIHTMNN